MRPILVAALLTACTTGASTPATAPAPDAASPDAATPAEAPEPAPKATAGEPTWAQGTAHESEPGHAGIIEAMGSAGACRASGMEKPSRALSWQIGDTTLYAAMCEGYAYQSDWEWWTGGDQGFKAVTSPSGQPARFLGMPSVSPTTGHVSWLTRSRGAGGCGDWHLVQLVDGAFQALEHRSRDCDPNPDPPPPHAWPLVQDAAPSAFPDASAVKAAAGGTVKPIINELSGEKAGEMLTRQAPAAVGGVPCGAVVHVYDDTWGCDVTEPFTLSGHTATGWTAVHYGTGSRANLIAEQLVPPQEHLDVGGVACQEWAHLHPDGSLAGCALRTAHTFGSVALPAKSDFTLRADGSLQTAVVYEDVSVGGKTLAAGTIEFAPDGSVAHHNADWFGD